MHVPPETMTVTFSNLGIQCVKKKDIEAALRLREEIKVDPYKSKSKYANDSKIFYSTIIYLQLDFLTEINLRRST